jgi:hypothetical protein
LGIGLIYETKAAHTVDRTDLVRRRPEGIEEAEVAMRSFMVAAALVAAPAAAQGQDTAWGLFESGEGAGAGVQAADGSQLLVKCDETGKREVYAVVFTQANLAVPGGSTTFEVRPITFRFDAGSPMKESWRFNGQTASTGAERSSSSSLSRFLVKLAAASKLDVLLEPVSGRPVEVSFNVTGAKDAIAQVYASCEDDSPIG